MRSWKQASALLLSLLVLLTALSGCGGEAERTLSVCAGPEPKSLDPIYAEAVGDQTILMNLYENLMRLGADASGAVSMMNGAAQNVSQEENFDGTVTYTFRLREAEWSDGEPVTAANFVYAWQRLADPANGSPYRELLSVVKGYDSVQETGDVSQLQVSAKDEKTFVVALDGKYDWFLSQVCTAPATLPLRQDVVERKTEEDAWWEDPEQLPTNGIYAVKDYAPGKTLEAKASKHYEGEINGPKTLTFHFAKTPEKAWKLYQDKTVDFVRTLPGKQAEASELRAPLLGTYSILTNSGEKGLPKALRSALNLAIDRKAVVNVLGGPVQAAEGLIPPGVLVGEAGDFRKEAGPALESDKKHQEKRVQEAQELIKSLETLPETIPYYYREEEQEAGAAVAEEVARQWKETLDLTVEPKAVTAEELNEALSSGEFALIGGWISAIGNEAECFLRTWSSESVENRTGYQNSAYDTLLSIISGAADPDARLACLRDAEALLLEDGAVMPLYTEETTWALRSEQSGTCRDSRGWFLFASCYH